MNEEISGNEAMHLTKSRLESLSDGIFAFAMTLLVIGLSLPDKSSITLSNQFASNLLVSLYSAFFHYVLAFLILGAFWLAHHIQIHPIHSLNRTYVWLNLSTLMFVALLPFSTSFSGIFSGVPLGAMVFEANLFAIGMGMFFQWRYATGRNRLVEPGMDHRFVRHVSIRSLIVPAISLLGISVALTGNTYSTAVYLLIPGVELTVSFLEEREAKATRAAAKIY